MRAIVMTAFGGPEVLRLTDIPEPEPEHPLPPPVEADAKLISELKVYRLAKAEKKA